MSKITFIITMVTIVFFMALGVSIIEEKKHKARIQGKEIQARIIQIKKHEITLAKIKCEVKR